MKVLALTVLSFSFAQFSAAEAKTNGPLLFSSQADGDFDIYIMNSDGTSKRKVLDTLENEYTPTFSSDGKKIAFSSDKPGGKNLDIYIMNSDGTGVQQVTTNINPDTAPTWSPDGKKLAFESKRSVWSHIYSTNLDGTDEHQLTTAYPNFQPTWSPDGKKIAMISERQWPAQYSGGVSDVFVMDAVQGDRVPMHRVTYSPREDHTPVWSPDGKKLAFISSRPLSPFDRMYSAFTTVYTVNADSDDRRGVQSVTPRILACHLQADDELAWSPDGNFIGFKRSGYRCPEGAVGHYIIKSDGSSVPVKLNGFLPSDGSFSWQSLP